MDTNTHYINNTTKEHASKMYSNFKSEIIFEGYPCIISRSRCKV